MSGTTGCEEFYGEDNDIKWVQEVFDAGAEYAIWLSQLTDVVC